MYSAVFFYEEFSSQNILNKFRFFKNHTNNVSNSRRNDLENTKKLKLVVLHF